MNNYEATGIAEEWIESGNKKDLFNFKNKYNKQEKQKVKNWITSQRNIKKLSNKELIDTINYKYENNLNDDDYIAELVRRRKATNEKIAVVEGEQFKLINKEKKIK